jgi:hypothetical protein
MDSVLGASAVGIFASSTRLPLVFATQPLDFSQWLLVTREEVPEELVNLVTSVIVEDRKSSSPGTDNSRLSKTCCTIRSNPKKFVRLSLYHYIQERSVITANTVR